MVGENSEQKKVLIVAYYWPPAGGGGVQRWLKFAKYLPEFGVETVVATPENPEYPVVDETLLKDVHDKIEVLKIPIWEPYKLFKLFTGKKKDERVNTGLLSKNKKKSITERISLWIRGNILIPDPRVFWVRPASRKLNAYIKEKGIETVITTGTPHSMHLIGLRLKRKVPIKWIVDFRDPWSDIDYLEEFSPSFFARRLQRKLEKKVLKRADKAISVSHHWAQDMRNMGAKNVTTITNGFDEEDFKNFNYNKKPEKFVLLYSGILHDYRNPEFFWNCLENICKENNSFAEVFELRLFGTIDDKVTDYIQNLPELSKRFKYYGYIPHSELMKEYEEASLLLLLQNDTKNALGHIPGKVFEYLATRKAIVGLGPTNGDVALLIHSTSSGKVFEFDDIIGIQTEVNKVYMNYLQNDKVTNTNIISNFSRKSLTADLVKLIG